MKKFVIAFVAAAAFAAPAMAGQPEFVFSPKTNNGRDTAGTITNPVAGPNGDAALITQPGPFVSNFAQTSPGARGDQIQNLLGH